MTYSASGGVAGSCANCGSDRRRVIDGYFDEARRSPRALAAGDHAALIYEDPATVAPFCARYLADGVNAGERVVAAIRDDLREAVSALLGSDVEQAVEWLPPVPFDGDFDAGRAAAGYEGLITAAPGATRILAAPDGASLARIDAAAFGRFEAIAHASITEHGATVVCVYDTRSVPPAYIPMTERRHGLVVEGDTVRRNERFEYQSA
jgi:DcmR-like sensory protein